MSDEPREERALVFLQDERPGRGFREDRHQGKRVLLLDAGRFMVSEHVQNLARIGLNVAVPIDPSSDPGLPRELVWGLPWRGNVRFPGLAYCTGGKFIYWGGWCPRLTPDDLAAWPAAIKAYLDANYPTVESETGVFPNSSAGRRACAPVLAAAARCIL
jgi:hypothetical protein